MFRVSNQTKICCATKTQMQNSLAKVKKPEVTRRLNCRWFHPGDVVKLVKDVMVGGVRPPRKIDPKTKG
ncbi:hypothetical protein OUZ56_015193 [Daphnia magna]|uniref:Uncharacterized protein n=1 Tax=Daphnia magna TaxID=35525 RepID=A0ABR0AM27_9CRUS|nr:hypothetical protein OUZ56_015193 [Daphnia magna]